MTTSEHPELLALGEEDDPHIRATREHLSCRHHLLSLEQMVREGWSLAGASGARRLVVGPTELVIEPGTVVWLRKFDVFRFARHLSGWEHGWAVEEWRALVDGLLAMLEGCRFLDDPKQLAAAESKVRQLLEAEALGFEVPEWFVGSDPGRLPPDPLVIKRLSPRRVALPPMMQPLTASFPRNLAATAEFSMGMNFVQRRVEGGSELRIVVVDDEVFSFRTPRDGYVDVREHYDTHTWTEHRLDPESKDRVVALARSLGLTFCTMDLIEDATGRLWFLEVNPRGNFLWLEEACNVPISKWIAATLDREVARAASRETG